MSSSKNGKSVDGEDAEKKRATYEKNLNSHDLLTFLVHLGYLGLKDYTGEVLLVGISYDKDIEKGNKRHTCKIEKVGK